MNIHKSQLFWGSLGVQGFDPSPCVFNVLIRTILVQLRCRRRSSGLKNTRANWKLVRQVIVLKAAPSEDRVDLGQDFDTLSNNQLSKEDPFFIWLSNGNFSDSECLWPAIEGWGCGRGRLVACRGGGGRWKVAAGSRKDTWLQHLDQFTVSYSGEMDLFSFHVRIYLALLLWDAICSVHLGWCQVIFGWGWVETCNQRPEIHQIVPYCCPLLPKKCLVPDYPLGNLT